LHILHVSASIGACPDDEIDEKKQRIVVGVGQAVEL
jgi:hypothetical protein